MDTTADLPVTTPTGTEWASVDYRDFDELELWRSSWRRIGNYIGRAVRVNGKVTTEYLHRVIMGCSKDDGMVVDHLDHNPFNNTRANLCVCTQSANLKNRRPYTHRRRGDG